MPRECLSKNGVIVPEFDWVNARHVLAGFGGDPITLHVYKSGLPFYDTLRLYGAIDLYVGTREDVSICDFGERWTVYGRVRGERTYGRDLAAFSAVRSLKKPLASEFCASMKDALISGNRIPSVKDPKQEVPPDLDPVLQSGIRGVSAAEYDSMNSSSNPRCKATVPLSEALVAYSGRVRTETIGEITFLPIFEGQIDLGKIVSPLRAWLSVPNPLCAQVLILLSLKTAVWSEGYEKRFSGVTYSKKTQKTSFNYSGIIRIDSTAIGKIDDGVFCGLLYRVFRQMLSKSWKTKKATPMAPHTFAVAEWLMQPVPRTLGPMITAQEFLLRTESLTFLLVPDNVRKVFEMTYSERKIDYDAVRRLAKATSSAIYQLGPADGEKKRKHWYNAVVVLRNAPNKEAFRHRVLTLIEQSRAADDWVGTAWKDEAFDPVALVESMGDDRPSFEMFRDCFRMYLIQESAPKRRPDAEVDSVDVDEAEDAKGEVGEEEHES
jgi:hypothetical protein